MALGVTLAWAAPERVAQVASGDDEKIKGSGNGHPTPSTILVVEDEVLIRLSVCDFLRECGYRVLEAGTGEDAQSVFESGEPIEVLFSDIDLGNGINGFVLATWVRTNYPMVRVVLASGVTRMALEAGHLCDAPFLQKPYSYEALADHIKRLLAAIRPAQRLGLPVSPARFSLRGSVLINRHVRLAPGSGAKTDIQRPPLRAARDNLCRSKWHRYSIISWRATSPP